MARPILAFPVLLLVGVNFAPVLAQNQPKLSTPSQQPAATQPHDAKPADVAAPDAILAATYDVISGPAGRERDWDRMRSLFYPGARLIRAEEKKEGGLGAGLPRALSSVREIISRRTVSMNVRLRDAPNAGAVLCRVSAPTNRVTTLKI